MEGTNTIVTPEITPGIVSGRITRKSVLRLLQPRSAAASMNKLDVRYLEAAADLGCNNRKTLLRVILPLTMPGVISGVTMVFVPSISTFYISQKLGGGVFDLLGDTIERQFQNAVTYHTGAAISLVMMVLILLSLAIMNKFSDRGEDIII